MHHKKTLTICSSASFYRKVLSLQKQLQQLGFSVKIPKTAYIMKRTGNFDAADYKTWHGNPNDYKKKTALIKAHFKKVLAADAILVINYEKNGLKGYIGGNVLMEMTLAFHFKKPIYILNAIDDNLPLKEEVYAMEPVFINGNLLKIK